MNGFRGARQSPETTCQDVDSRQVGQVVNLLGALWAVGNRPRRRQPALRFVVPETGLVPAARHLRPRGFPSPSPKEAPFRPGACPVRKQVPRILGVPKWTP